MSITVIKQLPDVCFTKNPVIIGLQTNNHIETAGVKSQFSIHFNSDPSNEQAFTLSFLNESVTLTCATVPDGSGTQFAPKGGALDLQWTSDTVDYIKKNYYLSKNFIISYNVSHVGTIFFLAKTESEQYNPELIDNTVSGLTLNLLSEGTETIYRPFFKNLVLVETDDQVIAEDALTPDLSGKTYHNIAEYILPFLSSGFTWPEITSSILNSTDNTTPFTVRYAEKYGSPAVVYGITSDDEKYAVKGGVSEYLYKSLVIKNSDVYSKLLTSKQFLTWQPDNKKVLKWQPEKLYFIAPEGTTQINLNVIAYFTDNSSQQLNGIQISVESFDIIEAIVTYNMLQLDTVDINKTVKYYTVQLTDQTSAVISVLRKYYPVTPGLFDRIFLFRNSLSGYDTFRSNGISQKNISVIKTDIISVFPDYGVTLNTRVKNQRKKKTDHSFTINSGWLADRKTADWFINEFLLSDDVYMWFDGQLYPVVVIADKTTVYTDDINQFAFEFTVEMDVSDQAYSVPAELLNTGDFNDSFNYDFNNNE